MEKNILTGGTSWNNRQSHLLAPEYAKVDKRTLTDLLTEVKELGKNIQYYNPAGQEEGTWEKFLDYRNGSNDQKDFIQDLAAFLEDPSKFENSPDRLPDLSRPHVGLVLIFLHLLRHVQAQANRFTEEHLDMLYHQVLKFEARGPQPDRIYARLELQEGVNRFYLAKGKYLTAGPDATGKPRQYKVLENYLLNRARIRQMYTLNLGVRMTIKKKVFLNELLAISELFNLRFEDEVNLQTVKNSLAESEVPVFEEITRPWDASGEDYVLTGQLVFAFRRLRASRFKNRLKELLGNALKPVETDKPEAIAIGEKKYKKTLTEDEFKSILKAIFKDEATWSGTTTSDSTDKTFPQVGRNILAEFKKNKAKWSFYILKMIDGAIKIQNQNFWTIEGMNLETSLNSAEIQSANSIKTKGGKPVQPLKVETGKLGNSSWNIFGGTEPQKSTPEFGLLIVSPILTMPDRKGKVTLRITIETPPVLSKEELIKHWQLNYSTAQGFVPIKGELNLVFSFNAIELIFVFEIGNLSLPPDPLPLEKVPAGILDSRQVMLQLKLVDSVPNGKGVQPYFLYLNSALKNVRMQLSVADSSSLSLRNDLGPLEIGKPFDLFGPNPKVGDSFYAIHPALKSPFITGFSMGLLWHELPANLATHYADYVTLAGLEPTSTMKTIGAGSLPQVVGYSVLRGQEKTMENGTVKMFFKPKPNPNDEKMSLAPRLKLKLGSPLEKDDSIGQTPGTDPKKLETPVDHYRFELQSPDFQHSNFLELSRKKAELMAAAGAVNKIPDSLKEKFLKPPYTPKINKVSCSYEMKTAWRTKAQAGIEVFGLGPLGGRLLVNKNGFKQLLPQYEPEGHCYLGLENVNAGESVSLFFKMGDGGTSNPDIHPQVAWAYLTETGWQTLDNSRIRRDQTRGLRQTGIVQLAIPADISPNGLGMPADRFWLRFSTGNFSENFPRCEEIGSQVVEAVFEDNGNDPNHYRSPLPAKSITGFVSPPPEVKTVSQPWPGRPGRSPENKVSMRTRISERIRHKHRALTAWDYERLVIDAFPEIYLVTCLPSQNIGEVVVLVVPDVRHEKSPEKAIAPYAPLELRNRVQIYLQEYCTPAVKIKVQNPDYLQVRVKAAVRIKDGLDADNFRRTLDKSLRKRLSPWAYEHQKDLTVNGKLYGAHVLKFIKERDYVEHVTDFSLDSKIVKDGKTIETFPNSYLVDPQGKAVIIVSAPKHEISLSVNA